MNTFTNVPVILMGFYGAWATVRAGVPRRYALVFLGLALIGIGSFGFHCSLKWAWQLMDELPMVSGSGMRRRCLCAWELHREWDPALRDGKV